jgi:hypothetical protein
MHKGKRMLTKLLLSMLSANSTLCWHYILRPLVGWRQMGEHFDCLMVLAITVELRKVQCIHEQSSRPAVLVFHCHINGSLTATIRHLCQNTDASVIQLYSETLAILLQILAQMSCTNAHGMAFW